MAPQAWRDRLYFPTRSESVTPVLKRTRQLSSWASRCFVMRSNCEMYLLSALFSTRKSPEESRIHLNSCFELRSSEILARTFRGVSFFKTMEGTPLSIADLSFLSACAL